MANVPVMKHKPGYNIAEICAKICHLSDSAQRHGDAGIAVVHSRYPSTSEQVTEWEPGAVDHLSPAFRRGRGPEWKIQGARYIGTLVEHLRRQTDERVARWVR